MTYRTLISHMSVAVLFSLVAVSGTAFAQGKGPSSGAPDRSQGQGGGGQKNCSQAEVREAENRSGGRMMSVSQEMQGGSTVCRVTVLVPSSGEGKPRRTVITVRP